MRIRINDKEVILPTSLKEFTLGQRIDYHNQHGRDLEEMAKSILEMPDGIEKDLEITHFQFEKMFRTFAFFTGCEVDAVKESQFIDDVASVYHSSLAVLFEEEANIELKTIYQWNGEEWELHEPKLVNGSKMKFGEFIDAKQVIKDLSDMGAGKWEVMLRLCTIYLLKKGEIYQEHFLYEGSERMELMKSLPMDIALAVGFFLNCLTNISINTLKSFKPAELKSRDDFQSSTLKNMAGSIS